jgi:hypothetical protein
MVWIRLFHSSYVLFCSDAVIYLQFKYNIIFDQLQVGLPFAMVQTILYRIHGSLNCIIFKLFFRSLVVCHSGSVLYCWEEHIVWVSSETNLWGSSVVRLKRVQPHVSLFLCFWVNHHTRCWVMIQILSSMGHTLFPGRGWGGVRGPVAPRGTVRVINTH